MKNLKILFYDFRCWWVLVEKYSVLYGKAPIWSYLFESNIGSTISHDLSSLALSEAIYPNFTYKWPKWVFLGKSQNLLLNHKIWHWTVWKWVLHKLNDIFRPYHLWIFEKSSTFPVRILAFFRPYFQ